MHKSVYHTLVLSSALVIAGTVSINAMAHNHGAKSDKNSSCSPANDSQKMKPAKHAGLSQNVLNERMLMVLIYKLDLTDAQEEALKDIFAQQKTQIQDQAELIDNMLDELIKLEPGSDPYNQHIDMIAQMRVDSWANNMKDRGHMHAAIVSMLNSKQRADFKKVIAEAKK
jgi:Spy/CpxP family protein refolding chaperone